MIIMIEERRKVKWKKKIREKAIDDCIEIIKFHRNSYDGIEWAIRDIEELKSKNLDV